MSTAAAAVPARASQAQIARLLNVSRQAISKLVARRVLVQDADGLLDVDLVRIALANRVRPSAKTNAALAATPVSDPTSRPAASSADAAAPPPAKATAPDDTATLSYHVAKTLGEAARARMDQLRLRKMQGELAEVAAIDRGVYAASRMLRDMVLAVPRRIAAELVACGDARTAERMMTEALRAAIGDFRQLVAAQLASAPANADSGNAPAPPTQRTAA